ncbi:MAG: HAMP domain-containing sensor histidine kinase [Oleispira sp.]
MIEQQEQEGTLPEYDNQYILLLLKRLNNVFYILFILSIIAVTSSFVYINQLKIATQHHYDSYLLSEQLRLSSDQLTQMARAYAATGNVKYRNFFNKILAIRNGDHTRPKNYHRVYWDFLMPIDGKAPFPEGTAISLDRLLERLHLDRRELDVLIKARQDSDGLTKLEDRAFELVAQQKNTQATAILYSQEYLVAKVLIMNNINEFYKLREVRSENLIKDREEKLYVSAGLSIILLASMIIILFYRFYLRARFDRAQVELLNGTVALKTQQIREKNIELELFISNLKKAQDKLIEVEKMSVLGGLVAGVAHEINTPIGVGITASSHQIYELDESQNILKHGKMTKQKLTDFMDHIRTGSELIFSNLNRVVHLIDSFKEVAVDQEMDEKRMVELHDYVDQVIGTLYSQYCHRPIEIDNAIALDLSVSTYPGSISKIVSQIVLNSLIYAFSADDDGLIKISCSNKQGHLELTISDDGKGMDKETLNHIFNPFFTTARTSGAVGLGMNVVYNLVTQKLGGDIRCESTLGVGTTILISFPIED